MGLRSQLDLLTHAARGSIAIVPKSPLNFAPDLQTAAERRPSRTVAVCPHGQIFRKATACLSKAQTQSRLDGPMRAIAKEAGVGVDTLHRHFLRCSDIIQCKQASAELCVQGR